MFAFNAGTNSYPSFVAAAAPPTLDADAILGNLTLNAPLGMVPSATGTVQWLAGGSISSVYTKQGTYAVQALTMLDDTTAASSDLALQSGTPVPFLLGVAAPVVLSSPWHANDPNTAIVYAGGSITASFTFIKPAKIQAGLDILNMKLVGENNNATDITSVIAGRDIDAVQGLGGTTIANPGTNFEIFGPGTFLIQAGRNLGPFFTGTPPGSTNKSLIGIEAVGDGSNVGAYKPFLPVQGADIYTLFGVGNGINYQAAIANFVDPSQAGANGIDLLSYIATSLGETRDQAWATFNSLPTVRQQLLVDHAYLQFLSQVGLDYNNPSSAYYHQYARAYQMISTLFPVSSGYTDNRPTSTNGAAATVSTGDLNVAHSLLETQTGGNIYILGPGGNIVVGANATDNTPPNQEGILTLQGGSILSYTDQSVQVYQSRIFTEQGGDIDLFTANGNLNAGKGKKTSASYPPLKLIWDIDGYSHVNPTGLVTGAGIGALLSVPGQDPSRSNVNLVAPRGTVDASAAGIRVSGNLNIAALQVLNAFNIQVQGTVTGLPTYTGPGNGTLTAANNQAGSAQVAVPTPSTANKDRPSIVIVEFIGFGGGNDTEHPDDQRHDDRRSYNEDGYDPDSTFRVIGSGNLTEEQKGKLTDEERSHL